MQLSFDSHPLLFSLLDVLSLYCAISVAISWWSGWTALAGRFRAQSEFPGQQWRFQRGQMRWMCGYNGCLTLGADSEGLYLATIPFLPLFHPPLFIPWSEITAAKKNLFFVRGVRFQLGKFPIPVSLWVRERVAERLKAAAGQSYPVETPG